MIRTFFNAKKQPKTRKGAKRCFMNLMILKNNYRSQILAIAEECNVETIHLFGSVARGDGRSDSDIDFLVRMKPNSGFGIGRLKWRLEELLHTKVDIVTEKSLHHTIRNHILKEAIPL